MFFQILMIDTFAGNPGICRLLNGFLQCGTAIFRKFRFDLCSDFGSGNFRITHYADLDVCTLGGLYNFLRKFGETFPQLIAVRIIPETFRHRFFIHNNFFANDFRTPMEQERGFCCGCVIIFVLEEIQPCGRFR